MPVISSIGRQRLKLQFSLLGMVLMAVLFTAACLQISQCTGSQCTTTASRLRQVFFATQSSTQTPTSSQVLTPQQTKSSQATSQLLTRPTAATTERQLKTFKIQLPSKTHSTPTQSSSGPYTIPTIGFVRRTFPVPPGQTHSSSIADRTSKHGCNKTDYCREYLSPTEAEQFYKCFKKCNESRGKFGPVVNGDCHFMQGQGRLPVALASFPGSGNTWIRGLLEKVTGICTGM